ncbi:MAG: Ig-like domain-containing protein [Candidatus Delongbacteria bacterium]|nr:Ig-like domain-containing protein [Candidatus Delongbacteria bacterium]
MRKLFILAFIILICEFLYSQETITTGSGGVGSYNAPINRQYNYGAVEIIYQQNKIGYRGYIDELYFQKQSGDIGALDNVTIYMKHTTSTGFFSGTTFLNGYQQVFSGSFPNLPVSGWVGVELDSAFSYNNVDNLQILIVKGFQNYTTNPPQYYGGLLFLFKGWPGPTRRYYSNTTPWGTTSRLNLTGILPHLRLKIEPSVDCSGQSLVGGEILPNSVLVNIGDTVSLGISGYSFLAGLNFNWQVAEEENGVFVNVEGGSGNGTSHYNTSQIINNAYYRCVLSCSGGREIGAYTDTAEINSRIIMVTDTLSVCNANFYDTGGESSDYSNFEDDIITFCSTNGKHVKIEFLDFQTETNGLLGNSETIYDFLYVYDGSTSSASEMFQLAGVASDTNKVPILISTNECLSLKFHSNDSICMDGWEAVVTCTDDKNETATQFCELALMMCEGETYYGSTSSFYNIENVDGQLNSKTYPGTLDNNSFYYFEASHDTAVIYLDVSNCSDTYCDYNYPGRIEFSVYSGDNCQKLSLVSSASYVTTGVGEGLDTIVLSNLEIWKSYYIVLDGWHCSMCDYSLTIDTGIQCCEDTYISGDTIGIIGQTVQLIANAPSTNKTPWASSNGIVATVDHNGVVTPNHPGVTTITYRDDFGCYPTYEFYVEVANLVVEDSVVNIDHINETGSIYLDVSWGKPPYTYLWMPDNDRLSFEEFSDLYYSIPDFDSLYISIDTLYNKYLSRYTDNSFTNLGSGEYKCVIIDALGDSALYSGFVNTRLILNNNDDFEIEDDIISNIDSLSTDTVATIFGGFFIPEDFSAISFKIAQDSLCAVFGLSYDAIDLKGDTLFNEDFTIDYGIIFENNQTKILHSGDTIETGILIAVDDEVIIKSLEDLIKIYIKDTLVYTGSASPKSGAAPTLTSSSNGALLSSLLLQQLTSAHCISQEITYSDCSFGNLNAIEMSQTGYNSVTYSWNGPGLFSSSASSIPESDEDDLIGGWYTVTCNANYGTTPGIGVSFSRSYFLGNHLIWTSSELNHINISGLSNSGYAESINEFISEDAGLYFEINLEGIVDAMVVGIQDENSNTYYARIIKSPNTFYMLPLGYIQTGTNIQIFKNNLLVYSTVIDYNEFGLSFEVDFSANEIIVSVLEGFHLTELFTIISTLSTTDHSAFTSIITPTASITKALSTFCFEQECPYHLMERTSNGGYARTIKNSNGEFLRFRFDEEYYVGSSETLTFEVVDLFSNTPVSTGIAPDPNVYYGENRYSFPISGLNSEHLYLLEVTNSKGEKRYLKFVTNDNIVDCNE